MSGGIFGSIVLKSYDLNLKIRNRPGMLVLPKLHQEYTRHIRYINTKKHPPLGSNIDFDLGNILFCRIPIGIAIFDCDQIQTPLSRFC